jgi:hypothetical protein
MDQVVCLETCHLTLALTLSCEVPIRSMMTWGGRDGGVALRILKRSTRWMWVAILTPWPLFPMERALGTHRIGACGDRRAATDILKSELGGDFRESRLAHPVTWQLSYCGSWTLSRGGSRWNVPYLKDRFRAAIIDLWKMTMKCCHLEETVNRSERIVQKSNVTILSSYMSENTQCSTTKINRLMLFRQVIDFMMWIIRSRFL